MKSHINLWSGGSVGGALDQHATEAGLIPWCGKGFFSQSQLWMQTLLQCLYTPVLVACINSYVHIKDLVVLVRVWRITETLKQPACVIGWVAWLSQLAFRGDCNPIFPWEKSQWGNTVVKKTKKVLVSVCPASEHVVPREKTLSIRVVSAAIKVRALKFAWWWIGKFAPGMIVPEIQISKWVLGKSLCLFIVCLFVFSYL